MSLTNFCILLAVSFVVISDRGVDSNSVNIVNGKSCYLTFDYNGPTSSVRRYFTKDGRPIRANKGRVLFFSPGRIYIAKVTDSDAGTYRLVVKGRGVYYRKEIILNGKSCVNTEHLNVLYSVGLLLSRVGYVVVYC